jgi:ubiquinone/menaquinone biosynthesis C-methylase UbiE
LGCGTGIISLGVAPCVESVVATDISPQMIAVAESKAQRMSISNVDFRVCDGYSLPYKSQAFDSILLFNVLHCVKEPSALLCEAHRLLKPSGRLVRTVFVRRRRNGRAPSSAGELLSPRTKGINHWRKQYDSTYPGYRKMHRLRPLR